MSGVVLDISAAGMAFQFDLIFGPTPGSPLTDIQLRMKDALCRLSGAFVGAVRGEEGRNLCMFQTPLPEETTDKIHKFIYQALQEEMTEIMRNGGQGKE